MVAKKLNKDIAPYEAVGTIAAQSLGEPGTQMTMRTFHYAGVAEHVPTGLPRLIELVDAKKEPKKPTMDMFFTDSYKNNHSNAEKVAKAVEEVVIGDIALIVDDLSNRQILIKYKEKDGKALGVSFSTLKEGVKKEYKNVRTSKSHIKISFKSDVSLRAIRKFSNKLASTVISGVPGIKRAVVIKGEKEFFIRASGSNIIGLIGFHKSLDENRFYTNNIKEMYRLYGVEAARAALFKEFKQVMDLQKLFVDVRHIMLISDALCTKGEYKSIGRHGLSGEKIGVLARAAFEETVKHLVNAASKAEDDELIGLTENIIIGQTVPVGTGNIKLSMKSK
ncbi:MAG: DNA-directed RNA polymerase subunit A'' [Candidatus ainarchaeum sp.]|nr:DNA-directed RNA polymerase subunit A'' [Candidatus ainarchaeum sp.]